MTARAEAEKAITDLLFKHQARSVAYRTGWEARCSGCDWVGAGFVQNVSSVTNIHRAHVASVLADLMADGPTLADAWDEGVLAVCDAAVDWEGWLRDSNGATTQDLPPNPYRVADTEGDR